MDQQVNQRQNTLCVDQQIKTSPENFSPTLLVMLETFRRSASCLSKPGHNYLLAVEHIWDKSLQFCNSGRTFTTHILGLLFLPPPLVPFIGALAWSWCSTTSIHLPQTSLRLHPPPSNLPPPPSNLLSQVTLLSQLLDRMAILFQIGSYFAFPCIIAMVHQNSRTVEFWQEKIEGNLRRANTETSVDFRRAKTGPSVDFRTANVEPSVRFRRANTETYYK